MRLLHLLKGCPPARQHHETLGYRKLLLSICKRTLRAREGDVGVGHKALENETEGA